jgi:hypothetical protein
MVLDAGRAGLERRAQAKGASARVLELARMVLLAADGLTGAHAAPLRPGDGADRGGQRQTK